MRSLALVAVAVGAAGSVGLMLLGGHPPLFLRVLFAIWVLSPFALAVIADRVSTRWPARIRAALYVSAIVVAASSLASYGYAVWGPPAARPAFMFVLVPQVSWLLMTTAVSAAALTSRRRSP